MRRAAWCFLAAALGGCATTPAPLWQANWYFQSAGREPPELYVAVMNRADVSQPLTALRLNDLGATRGGWSLPVQIGRELLPGELVVRRAAEFKRRATPDGPLVPWPACMLPVAIDIESGRPVLHLSMAHQMPSALPDSWTAGCPPTSVRTAAPDSSARRP